MKRTLIHSARFIKRLKRFLKLHPDQASHLQAVLEQLSDDAIHPSLKTHKLHGVLSGSLACSVGYDLRIVFEILVQDEGEGILLQSIGTHEEVY